MLSRNVSAWWGPLVLVLPLVLLTLAFSAVALIAAVAREPGRCRHLLRLLDRLTAFAAALRGQR